jgi:hypothetical protein
LNGENYEKDGEVKCFNAIAWGEEYWLYVLE